MEGNSHKPQVIFFRHIYLIRPL